MTSMTRYTLTASSLILDSEPGTSGDAAWALRGTGTRMSCPRHVRNPVTSLCTRYLPFQTGARFSAKARAPSRASSEVKTGCMSRAAWSHRPAAGQSPPCWAISLVAMSASGPLAAIFSASSSAAASAWPSSTTRLTRPISAARRASIGSPVSSSSSARARGTRCASSSAPPAPATSDRLTSGTPNRAEAPATTRSHASSSSNPPASAQPSAAPISGLRGGVCVMPHSPRPGNEGDSPFRNALRSIPEENVPPAPLSTPARSSSSASSSSAASRIPAATAPFRALRASGRLMMMTCTAPRRSTCTSSLIASVPPRLLDQPLALFGQGGELTEVPAGDLGRRDAQPGVPTVVRHVRGPEVFSGHEPLGFGELGGLGVCVAGPRDGADDGGLALDLDAVQLGVVLAPVDHSRHPGIALQVGPALAAGQRVDPQGAAGPGEPDRRDVRAVRPEGRQPTGPLPAEERIHFPGTHRDHPAAPLLSHPHTSLRGLLETIMADEEHTATSPGGIMADRPPPPPAGQPDELSALDYLFHRGEAHPATRSAFLDLEILDRPADWGRLREAMDRASRVVIRMRQKVVVPPVPTTPPRWVVDPDFDLDYHLRRVALPAPGTLRQLLDLAEVTLQSPLDTSRALWEAVYVEGLAGNKQGGRAALMIKLSHAITDGLGALALFEQIYDTEREPEPRPMPPVPVPRDLSGEDLLRDSLRQLPATTLSTYRNWLGQAVGTAARLVTRPGPTVAEVLGFVDSTRRVLGPPPAEPSPLLRRRSLVTRTHVLELPLTDLRAAAKAVGGSVNDAYLAALCGGLGRYHEVLGVPVEAVPMAIPVSLRTGDDPASGNQWAGVTIAAPIGESDPSARMKQIREQVIARRSEPAIDLVGRIAPVLNVLPDDALLAVTDRVIRQDIQASNVPGYAQETFLAGARADRRYGLGPLPRVAMMAVLISRAGTCTVTFRCDTASFTAIDQLEKCLQLGFDEIVELGRPRTRSAAKTRPAPKTAGTRRRTPPRRTS